MAEHPFPIIEKIVNDASLYSKFIKAGFTAYSLIISICGENAIFQSPQLKSFISHANASRSFLKLIKYQYFAFAAFSFTFFVGFTLLFICYFTFLVLYQQHKHLSCTNSSHVKQTSNPFARVSFAGLISEQLAQKSLDLYKRTNCFQRNSQSLKEM